MRRPRLAAALLVGALLVIGFAVIARYQDPIRIEVCKRVLGRSDDPDRFVPAARQILALVPDERFLEGATPAFSLRYHLAVGYEFGDIAVRRRNQDPAVLQQREGRLLASLRDAARAHPEPCRRALAEAEEAAVRRRAAHLLGIAGDPAPLPALFEAFTDADADVANAAHLAALRLSLADPVPVHIEALRTRSLRPRALRELRTRPDPRAVPSLIRLLESKPDVTQVEAIGAILRQATGAPLDPAADGAAWREWYVKNRGPLPEN